MLIREPHAPIPWKGGTGYKAATAGCLGVGPANGCQILPYFPKGTRPGPQSWHLKNSGAGLTSEGRRGPREIKQNRLGPKPAQYFMGQDRDWVAASVG